MKTKCSITVERQSVLLVYPLYKAIHMDALILIPVPSLVTLNDLHHFS